MLPVLCVLAFGLGLARTAASYHRSTKQRAGHLMSAAALPAGNNISSILKAANIEVEPYWPTLFAKLCKGKNIGDMLSAVGSAPAAGGGGGGAAAAAPAAGAAAGAAPAAKAPEPEPVEEEEEMGFDLFGAPRVGPMPRALLTRTRGSGSCCALFCWRRRAERMPSHPPSQIKHSFLLVRVPNGCISCEPVVRYDGAVCEDRAACRG